MVWLTNFGSTRHKKNKNKIKMALHYLILQPIMGGIVEIWWGAA